MAAFLKAFPGAYVIGKSQDPPSQAVALAAAEAREERDEHSDTNPDVDAPQSGAGWIGYGDPLSVGRAGKHRGIQDGAGLCSPGRWLPEKRRYPVSPDWLSVSDAIWAVAQEQAASGLVDALASASISSDPFPSCKIEGLRNQIKAHLTKLGCDFADRQGDRIENTPCYRLFGALLHLSGDLILPASHLSRVVYPLESV